MSLHILSLHHLKPAELHLLQSARPDIIFHAARPADAAPYLADTDILLAFEYVDLAPLLPKMPHLKWVHALSAGVDRFLTKDTLLHSPVLLTNSRGIHGIPMAEHVLGIMLGISRCLPEALSQQKAHLWQRRLPTEELYEKTAAIIGLGSIGHEIAKRLHMMGMKILAVKQTITPEPYVDQLFTAKDLLQVLPAADYIIVTLPLTPATKDLFNYAIFRHMKPTTFFINISRGPVVNSSDIVRALQEHIIRGAALDVFPQEPLPPESPLWDTPNLFITPHIAAASPQYMTRALQIFIQNLKNFPQETAMRNLVDKTRGY